MTREEALVQLRIGPGINEDVSEEYNEAVDIAIKALEQQPSENEQIIKVSKGVLKARTGRFVIYDAEWLKENFNTTEAKIYGQPSEDCISRKAAIDALWKALYEYEDKTENQFLESKELDAADWFQRRIFVQNMSDIDRQTILNLPSVTPQPKTGYEPKTGHWIYFTAVNTGEIIWSECSKCGNEERGCAQRMKYCPECGIKMQEVKK